MSNRPIQVGDLVVVVRKRLCGCRSSVGNIFIVQALQQIIGRGICIECGQLTFPIGTLAVQRPNRNWVELSRVKRIPPLEELEGQRTEESTRDPAHNFERHFKVKA